MSKETQDALTTAFLNATEVEPLSSLADYLIEGVKEKRPKFELKMTDFKVTGRKNKHKVSFNFETIVKIDGRRFRMAGGEETCWEDKTLTFELPYSALNLSSS